MCHLSWRQRRRIGESENREIFFFCFLIFYFYLFFLLGYGNTTSQCVWGEAAHTLPNQNVALVLRHGVWEKSHWPLDCSRGRWGCPGALEPGRKSAKPLPFLSLSSICFINIPIFLPVVPKVLSRTTRLTTNISGVIFFFFTFAMTLRRVEPKYTSVKPGVDASAQLWLFTTCTFTTTAKKTQTKTTIDNSSCIATITCCRSEAQNQTQALAKSLRPMGLQRVMTPCIWMSVTVIRVIDKGDKQ